MLMVALIVFKEKERGMKAKKRKKEKTHSLFNAMQWRHLITVEYSYLSLLLLFFHEAVYPTAMTGLPAVSLGII